MPEPLSPPPEIMADETKQPDAKTMLERAKRINTGETSPLDQPKQRIGLSTPEKAAIYSYAASIAGKLRPATVLPPLPVLAVPTDTPIEAERRRSDYAKAYASIREAAEGYAVDEAKGLWKKLFGEEF